MSYISFQNKDQIVYVSGRERAWFNCLISNLCGGVLDLALNDPNNYSKIKEALAPKQDWVNTHSRNFAEDLHLVFHTGMDEQGIWQGKPLDLFSLKLNTALALGGDALRMATRIHGQCEVYGYFRAENGPWAARIIEQGLRQNIFRHDNAQYDGWSKVASLLAHTKGTVVMAYSVCYSFPEGVLTQEERETDVQPSWEACLYRLIYDLRGLKISPETWDDLFDHELTLLDLIKNSIRRHNEHL